jgi:hypothetical protein
MTLWLHNRTSSRISAAITFADRPMCGGEGGNYHVRGWWNIDPGLRIKVDYRDVADVGVFGTPMPIQRARKLLNQDFPMPALRNGSTVAGSSGPRTERGAFSTSTS